MKTNYPNMPCIILSGGFGTRLQSSVSDVVKPMAPMGHKPFLHVLMDHLYNQGISHFILALGYKSETAINYFDALVLPYKIDYSIEIEPLGTGGAIRQALENVENNEVLVLNGDTFFDLPIQEFIADAKAAECDFYMALKTTSDASRYGNVHLNQDVITSFSSENVANQLQNAGVYWLKRNAFLSVSQTGKFSLENDFFPLIINKKTLKGKAYSGYFIDIGIPEDYQKAKEIFSRFYVDSSWTLFLDRDGVINVRLVGDYIKSVEEFEFIPGVLNAIVQFSKQFGKIVVVTNQQGISKGKMTERNLEDIHRYMRLEIEKHSGRIDAIYHAPQLASEQSEMRKPNVGMAKKAQLDFPEINFEKSVMIGDSDSDIEFGQALGMITVKLDAPETSKSTPTMRCSNLESCLELFEEPLKNRPC